MAAGAAAAGALLGNAYSKSVSQRTVKLLFARCLDPRPETLNPKPQPLNPLTLNPYTKP